MDFVALQTLDGRTVFVNPALVVSVATPRDDSHTTLNPRVECVVTYVDGKFTTVMEACDSVRRRIEAAKK